jgi:phage regulator Rha-like protein
MLDSDLAKIYQVDTKRLNEAVRRNIRRFPPEFMFQLTKEEFESLRSQFASSKNGRGGRTYLPFVFTEHGVIMLSAVLNSAIAEKINISVVKAFIEMRRYIVKPARKKLDDLEKILMLHIDDTNNNFSEHAAKINDIIAALGNLIESPPKPRRRIGFVAN